MNVHPFACCVFAVASVTTLLAAPGALQWSVPETILTAADASAAANVFSNLSAQAAAPAERVEDTEFSADRGFFEAPFQLEITTDTPGATIRYTLDGAAPSEISGRLYTGPLNITNTTVVRAIASKSGMISTDVDTQTYLFIDDILRQPGMDPDIVNQPGHAQDLRDGFLEIPSVSIAGTNLSSNFDEAPVSVEFIYPNDPGHSLQVGSELRLTQAPTQTIPKPVYNLRFKTEAGPAKLRWNLFKHAPNAGEYTHDPQVYDRLHLKGTGNDWYGTGRRHALYLRDAWTRDSQIAVSGDGSHGMPVHLYRNGEYLGLFNLCERPDTWWAANHLTGTENDWYSPKFQTGTATATRLNYLNTVLLAKDMSVPSHYAELKQYLDVAQFIDYLIVNFYAAVKDWHDQQNAFNTAPLIQTAPPGQLKYLVWDADQAWDLQGIDPPFTFNLNFSDGGGRHQQICHAAAANPDFRMLFADRVYRHLFNGGALTVANAQRRWTNLVNAVRNAILAEQARWGDQNLSTPPTREANWLPEVTRVLGLMQSNVDEFIAMLRQDPDGLYPPNDPPQFSRHGGEVPAGLSLTLGAGAGTILFTWDGSDPRWSGGAVSSVAQVYSAPLIILSNVTIKARLRTGGTWSALAEAAFYPPQDLSKLAITEIMFNPPRLGDVDGDEFEFLELKNTGTNTLDLTGLRFNEGITCDFAPGTRLMPGAFLVLVRSTNQFAAKYPDVCWHGVFSGKMANEGERLTLVTEWGARVLSIEYGDRAPWPVAADGYDFSLVPLDPVHFPSSDRGDRWRASAKPGGSPGADDSVPAVPRVLINEVLAAPLLTSPNAGSADYQSAVSQAFSLQNAGSSKVFPNASAPGRMQISDTADSKSALRTAPATDAIELHNPNAQWVDVSGWFLTDEVDTPRKFRIPDGTMIAPGGFVVFTEADFNPTPGTNGSFALNSSGEQIYLFSADTAGNFTGYTHGFSFGASAPGISFGRHVTSTGEEHFPPQSLNSFGTHNSGPRLGPVVLTEIHYHPAPGGDEFIELQNITTSPVQLFDPDRPTNTWKLGGLSYSLPSAVTLASHGILLLVATNPAAFRARSGVPAEVEILGPWSGTLQDSGELLELQRPGTPGTNGSVPYFVMDAVRYNDKPPWPIEPDGTGPALERVNRSAYANDSINWRASSATGGTPGTAPPVATTPILAVGQTQIVTSTFVGADATPEVFHVWNAGISNVEFIVVNTNTFCTVVPGSGASDSSSAPSVQTTYFHTAALAIGTYSGSLLVTDDGSGATNGPIAVAVICHILPLPTPEIGLSTASLFCSTLVGHNALSTEFDVWNDGVGTLDYAVTVDVPWLTVNPTSGSLLNLGLPQTHELQFETAQLPPGLHTALITLAAPEAVPAVRHVLVALEVRSSGSFVGYNDFAWKPGQWAHHITTHTTADGGGGGDGGGVLVDHATGESSGITLLITGGAYFGDWQADLGALSESSTEAYDFFNGRVDCHGFLSFASTDLVLGFSGLDPSAQYEVVLFGNCDIASYPDRLLTATIEGALSFANASTPGAAVTGARHETTTVAAGYNTRLGQVIRYTAITPALDGRFRLRVPAADTTEASHYYLNALRFATTAAAAPPQLRLTAVRNGNFALSWTGTGYTLEQAPAILGPWTTSTQQHNPQWVPAAGGSRFFRLVR